VSEEITESAEQMLMYRYQTNSIKNKEEEKKLSLQNETFATSNISSPLIT